MPCEFVNQRYRNVVDLPNEVARNRNAVIEIERWVCETLSGFYYYSVYYDDDGHWVLRWCFSDADAALAFKMRCL